MTLWYLAICENCEPCLPQPFLSADERDAWAAAHRETGHRVRQETQSDDRPLD